MKCASGKQSRGSARGMTVLRQNKIHLSNEIIRLCGLFRDFETKERPDECRHGGLERGREVPLRAGLDCAYQKQKAPKFGALAINL